MTYLDQHPPYDLARLYDRLAPDYDRLHRRWLRHAGAEAQVALEASVRAMVTDTTKILDAGCGTGAFARRLVAEGVSPASLTLLDPSDAMLARCADVPALKVKGRLEALPFEDDMFDLVTCAWVLETVPDFESALAEVLRVVRPGGSCVLTFCAEPDEASTLDRVMQWSVRQRGSGRFLCPRGVLRDIEKTGVYRAWPVCVRGPAATVIARRQACH